MIIPEKDRPIVISAGLILLAIFLASLAGCADVPVKHYRPEMGCYQSICEYSAGYDCSCWAPGQCFTTRVKCEENLKATVKSVSYDLFQELAKTGELWTI